MVTWTRAIGLSLEWSCHGVVWLGFVTIWLVVLWRDTPTVAFNTTGAEHSHLTYRMRDWSLSTWQAGPTGSLFPSRWTQAVCLMFALLLDLCLVGLVKTFVRRPRPKDDVLSDMRLTVPTDRWSFPSGHASRASLLFWLIPHIFVLSPVSIVSVFIWMVIICYSRFAMKRHYATDILAGALLGFLEYRLIWMIDWVYVTYRLLEFESLSTSHLDL